MTIDMNGPTYLTGHKGPWEYFASGVALNRLVQTEALKGDFPWASSKVENTQAVIGRHLHLGVNEGEVDSLRILDKFCKELSIGLTNLVLLLDLELIVIGGGLCEIGEPLRKNVENWIEKLLPGENHRPTIKVKLAETGVDAGAVGAALSAYNYFNL